MIDFYYKQAGDIMSNSSNNHPPTEPRNGHGVSHRGLLSIAMLILSIGALGIAALASLMMILDVLGGVSNFSLGATLVLLIVMGLAYAVGWFTAVVAIRVYGNLILPILIKWAIWACLVSVCYLYLAILKRM